MPTLSWLTRARDVKAADAVSYRLLERDDALSFGDAAAGNMLIQGDNLEALKSLLPYYRGRVKCIYIDPPFNTRDAISDFYDDNLEHAAWLGMMYPRLDVLQQLLSDDGTLFVHLDDNEIAYATVVLDEIMGRKNRVSTISFKQSSVSGPKARNPGVVTTTNYLVVYSKNKSQWRPNNTYRSVPRDVRYGTFIENYEEPFENWRFETLTKALERHLGLPLREWKRSFNGDVAEYIERFVLSNRDRVVQLVAVAAADVNEKAREKLLASLTSGKVERQCRDTLEDYYFYNGKQVVSYRTKSRLIDGVMTTAERVSNLWDDLLSNNVHQEGGVKFPNGKKPEALVRRCLEIATTTDDLVLDSFLGSGTTASVAHKMGRRWIGVEMGEHAVTHCVPRLHRVIEGEQSGISKAVGWKGGSGFDFYRLGPAVFDGDGTISQGIAFTPLAAHIWFSETETAFVSNAAGPFLGWHGGQGLALLYNGILGDKRISGGNVLTRRTLATIREGAGGIAGPIIVYGEASRLGPSALKAERITFKQTPYDVRAR